MAEAAIKGLKCAGCGSSVPLRRGELVVACPACSTLYRVEGLLGIQRFLVKNQVSGQNATGVLAKWFKKFGIRGSFKRGVKITQANLLYVPMWYYAGTVVGWRFGYNIRTYTDSRGRTHRKKVYKEHLVNGRFWWSDPATGVGELGVRAVFPEDKDLEFYVPSERPQGEFLEITEDESDAEEEGRNGLYYHAKRRYSLEHVTDQFLDVTDDHLWLVYYPFWQLTYEYKGMRYTGTVDGATGRLRYARAPKGEGMHILPWVFLMPVAGFVLGVLGIILGEKTAIVAGVFALGLGWFAGTKLAFGGEVVHEE